MVGVPGHANYAQHDSRNVTIIKLEKLPCSFCCNHGLSTGDMSLFRKEMITGS